MHSKISGVHLRKYYIFNVVFMLLLTHYFRILWFKLECNWMLFFMLLRKKTIATKKKNLHHLWFLHCALNLIFLSVMTVCLPLLQPHIDWNNTFCIGISHLTVEFLSHLEFLKILSLLFFTSSFIFFLIFIYFWPC